MRDELHTLAGAYALDALPSRDRRLFEGHLRRCEICAVEVRGLQAAAGRLGGAVAESPPPRLRAAVLSRIDQTRQLPPVGDSAARTTARAAGLRRVLEFWRRWRLGLSVVVAAGAVAASVVVAASIDAESDRVQRRLVQAEAANRDVAAVLAAGDARAVTQPIAAGGTATVVASRSRGRLVFAGDELGRLPSTRTYELWLMGPDGVRPAGLFRPDASGRIPPIVTALTGRADRVGVTTEPAGGSPQPTSTPLVTLPLT